MRLRIISLALAILLLATLPATASEIPVEEALLPGGFLIYEVNRGADGLLYVTDLYGGNIWRINPATGAYDGFWVPGMPQDARADSSGNIWYTDWSSPTLGRISGGAQPKLTTWDLSLWQNRTYSLAGTAIDSSGRVWFSEYDSTSPRDPNQQLFRFTPNTSQPNTGELCGYSLPGSGDHSYYLLASGSFIWLGDWVQGRIVQFDTNPPHLGATYWDAADVGEPRGLAIDASNNIWWADEFGAKIRRLNLSGANINKITTYTPPSSGTPFMVAVEGGRIWYTAQDTDTQTGFVGILDPGLASGSTGSAITPAWGNSTADCRPLSGTGPADITPTPGTLAWGAESWVEEPGSGAGWTVYNAEGYPWGILPQARKMWVADQWWQQLVRITLPLAAPVVTIARSGADVRLTWTTVDGATMYRTWYSATDPYFASGGTLVEDPVPTDLIVTHSGVADQRCQLLLRRARSRRGRRRVS